MNGRNCTTDLHPDSPGPCLPGHGTWDPNPGSCPLVVTCGNLRGKPGRICSMSDPLPATYGGTYGSARIFLVAIFFSKLNFCNVVSAFIWLRGHLQRRHFILCTQMNVKCHQLYVKFIERIKFRQSFKSFPLNYVIASSLQCTYLTECKPTKCHNT